jgi:hypothetical protein
MLRVLSEDTEGNDMEVGWFSTKTAAPGAKNGSSGVDRLAAQMHRHNHMEEGFFSDWMYHPRAGFCGRF